MCRVAELPAPVGGVEANIVSLANGGLCWQNRDHLAASIAALLARPESIGSIVLEARGVADPAGMFMTVNNANLWDPIWQAGFADMGIKSQVAPAGPTQVAKARRWSEVQFERESKVESDYCAVPCESSWALRAATRGLAGTIGRTKRVIDEADASRRRAVLQVVGRRVDMSVSGKREARAPRTQAVVIGWSGGVNASLRETTVASCIAAADAG
jgi:G3E family GTPase